MLRWDWNKPIGKITWKDFDEVPYETKVFRGNAMIICITEWTDKDGVGVWQMGLFLVDKKHFKAMCKIKPHFTDSMMSAEFWDLNSETWSFVKELHRRGVQVDIHGKPPKDNRRLLEG